MADERQISSTVVKVLADDSSTTPSTARVSSTVVKVLCDDTAATTATRVSSTIVKVLCDDATPKSYMGFTVTGFSVRLGYKTVRDQITSLIVNPSALGGIQQMLLYAGSMSNIGGTPPVTFEAASVIQIADTFDYTTKTFNLPQTTKWLSSIAQYQLIVLDNLVGLIAGTTYYLHVVNSAGTSTHTQNFTIEG